MKILLGVSGSIAAYKSFDICRQLIHQGHKVKVVLTQGALAFVKPEVFLYLGAERVYTAEQDFLTNQSTAADTDGEFGALGTVPHIHLSRWCDRLVVAPLSANTLGKLARGEANDLLTSIFLSIEQKPVVLYPAMNPSMLNHPFTQENIERLKNLPHVFVYPADAGLLVCGEKGEGKFPPFEHVVETCTTVWPPQLPKKNKQQAPQTILITAGATISPLDPIRFLTNPSSGKTAYLLAKRYLRAGHQVMVVAGAQAVALFDALLPLPQFTLKRVVTTTDMEREVTQLFPRCQVYISTAAICDFEFTVADQKIKKDSLASHLPFKKTTDILEKVLGMRTPSQILIGFAAETDPSPEVLRKKWQRKPVDLLIGNPVHSGLLGRVEQDKNEEAQTAQGFGTDHGQYHFFRAGQIEQIKNLSKLELAEEIFHWTTTYDSHHKKTP